VEFVSPTRKLLVPALTLLAALVMALSACGSGSSASANEVDMGVADFKQHSITITAGQALHLVDPANGGGTHILCIGKGQQCVPAQGAPGELNTTDGVTFNPGDTKDVVFPAAGTFDVVCTIHPEMVVTVVVQ
jgi:plastocyanin